MTRSKPQDASLAGPFALLIFVVFFLFLIIFFFGHVPVFVKIFVVFFLELILFFVFLEVVGDGIQRNRMSLRNLQFGLTLRAAKDLAFFHLVFVHVNFCGTFWAAEHGCIPPK